MPRKRRNRRAALLGAFTVVASSSVPIAVPLAQPAAASLANCGGTGAQGPWFDGMWRQLDNSHYGVSANITVRTGSVCDSDHTGYNPATGVVGNFTTAWTMIADSNNDGVTVGWLQSGYLRAYGQSLVTFSQFWNAYRYGGVPVTVFGSGVSTGTVHRYWQQGLLDAQGEWHSNVDTTRLINTSPGVLTDHWSGYSQQFSGEVLYKASDIVGSSSFPASFTNLQIQSTSGAWQSIPNPYLASINQNPDRWSVNPTSSTSFNVWTHNYG